MTEQTQIPMEGKGVAEMRDKELDALCLQLKELREKRAVISEEIGQTEFNVIVRMKQLDIEAYRFLDQIAKVNPGKDHVKIKCVRPDHGDEETDADEA